MQRNTDIEYGERKIYIDIEKKIYSFMFRYISHEYTNKRKKSWRKIAHKFDFLE